jgi:hypothetical protein
MPSSQCPNIKTEILALRVKVSEIELLKASLLRRDPAYLESFERMQNEIEKLTWAIDKKIDRLANEIVLPEIERKIGLNQVIYFSQGRARMKDSIGKWSHIGIDKKFIYEARYEYVGSKYSEDRAVAGDSSSNYFHINRNGEPAYAARYPFVGDYCQGRAWAKDDVDNRFHINLDGEPAYAARYAVVNDYVNGIARVKTKDGEEIEIDLKGNQIIK